MSEMTTGEIRSAIDGLPPSARFKIMEAGSQREVHAIDVDWEAAEVVVTI